VLPDFTRYLAICIRLSANLNRLTVPRCRLRTYGCQAFYHAGPRYEMNLEIQTALKTSFFEPFT